MTKNYEELGRRVGALVDVKNAAYGSSFDDAGSFLRLLYPNGIQPNQYGDALALVRIFDKMKRIATDRDALGESPYQDIAGYGLLGLNRVEKSREVSDEITKSPTIPPPPAVPVISAPSLKDAVMQNMLAEAASARAPAGEVVFNGEQFVELNKGT